jgi:uncharacterized protein with NAD-binding domain and iron-sulfur cluster
VLSLAFLLSLSLNYASLDTSISGRTKSFHYSNVASSIILYSSPCSPLPSLITSLELPLPTKLLRQSPGSAFLRLNQIQHVRRKPSRCTRPLSRVSAASNSTKTRHHASLHHILHTQSAQGTQLAKDCKDTRAG